MEWRDHVLPATHGASELWCESRMMNVQGTRTWSILWLVQGLQNFREWYHFTRVAIYFDPWSLDEFQPLELGGWAACKKALATFGPSWWNMYIYIYSYSYSISIYIYICLYHSKTIQRSILQSQTIWHMFYAQFWERNEHPTLISIKQKQHLRAKHIVCRVLSHNQLHVSPARYMKRAAPNMAMVGSGSKPTPDASSPDLLGVWNQKPTPVEYLVAFISIDFETLLGNLNTLLP